MKSAGLRFLGQELYLKDGGNQKLLNDLYDLTWLTSDGEYRLNSQPKVTAIVQGAMDRGELFTARQVWQMMGCTEAYVHGIFAT
jgi:hypothetical protein